MHIFHTLHIVHIFHMLRILRVLSMFQPMHQSNIGFGRCPLSFEEEMELLVRHIALSVLKPKSKKQTNLKSAFE